MGYIGNSPEFYTKDEIDDFFDDLSGVTNPAQARANLGINGTGDGYTGSQGTIGYTGSRGNPGTNINVVGSVALVADLPVSGNTNDAYFVDETNTLYVWDGTQWYDAGAIVGPVGDTGYVGSQGITGYTGSRGNPGTNINVKGSVSTVADLPAFGNTNDAYFVDETNTLYVWNGIQWYDAGAIVGPIGPTGYAGSQGTIGYTGSRGNPGTNINVVGSVALVADLPVSGNTNDAYFVDETNTLYVWDGTQWYDAGAIVGPVGDTGYTGSSGADGTIGIDGYTGSVGYTGSIGVSGTNGYTGSQGIPGEYAAVGYTGSAGVNGTIGVDGYTGSQGTIGYTGSSGDLGYTGSQGNDGIGTTGYTGSAGADGTIGIDGYTGSVGYTGSQGNDGIGTTGYTGSQGIPGEYAAIGYTGSAGADGTIGIDGYTGSQGLIGYTGSAGDSGGSGSLSVINDSSTDTVYYVSMSDVSGGTWSNAYVSTTKLFFNPSTGTLNSTIFNSLSDKNYKTNIKLIDKPLDTINSLLGVEFDWIDSSLKSAGVIAQDLELVLPHLVDTSETGVKSVNYLGIIAYLIEAVKELDQKLNMKLG